MNLLTISGCDKVVHSAVVEEKDKTVVKTEENKEKETVQKTVAEQVQAPETYQTTIQSDLRSAERTDQENPMKFTLTADAPIEAVSYTHLYHYISLRVIFPDINGVRERAE